MANEEHLALLKQGANTWNRARTEELRDTEPDLQEVDLSGWDLSDFDLSETNFTHSVLRGALCISANLREANLTCADMQRANLHGARLDRAILHHTDLSYANLGEANFREAELDGAILVEADMRLTNCYRAKFRKANLCGANLSAALLVKADFQNAILTGCRIYGASVWDLQLHGAEQFDIVISPFTASDPVITVDNLEVAQFVYLLLDNKKIREVIDTITSKAVLILGRFNPPERKAVLDAIREELRRRNYLPILFDFEQPTARDFTETIMTLTGMCLFIIADITNPKSSPLELQATIPNYMVPFVPIIHEGEQPFSMFRDLKNKHPDWVLDVLAYDSAASLVRRLENAVIRPALKKHVELLVKKVQELQIRHVKDYPDDEELV